MDIAQLFIIGFDGCRIQPTHPLAGILQKLRLGGVLLFDRNIDGRVQNITSSDQLSALTSDLRELGGEDLLIAVDQEGGRVCRLKERDGFPATQSAAFLGAGPVAQTKAKAGHLSAVLRRHGINFNLAPVVDLNSNPHNPIIGRYERSFGRNPQAVAEQAGAWINAHHEQGVACCLKHFPGHGSSSQDSHLGFVDVSKTWHEEELEPYARLIKQGLADSVMSAHVVHQGLDPSGLPATLSRPILQGILRNQLDFQGVILTDDLQMRAIKDKWSLRRAVQGAILAGADLLVIGNNLNRDPGAIELAIAAVEELLTTGQVPEERIQASLQRIAVLQKKISGAQPWTSVQTTT